MLPPDVEARVAILASALAERPVADVDLRRLARKTAEYSGADLVHVVETASEEALGESIRTGGLVPISTEHLERALVAVKPSTRAWFTVAHNYALYANDGGQYDDLLAYIRTHKLL